jgi:hypothetical protein
MHLPHVKSSGRLVLIVASLSMWLLILVSLRSYGYHETWRLWKVPSAPPAFLDFRLIPGSAESLANGYEPSVENPYDPQRRIFNYPAFWRLFFYAGITQDDTVWMSVSMILLFTLAVLVFPKRLSVAGSIGMLLVVFSPASMLLYERGNVDLIVFVICVMVVIATDYSAYLAAALVVFGAIVKYFPLFGVTVFFREPKHRCWRLFAGCVLPIIVYMAATSNGVSVSWNRTMRGDVMSYGTNVFVTRYGRAISRVLSEWLATQHVEWLLRNGPVTVAVVLLLLAVFMAVRNREQPECLTERNVTAFRMGASIYVGTFLLGNNWDYRLAFLVLTVPQLVEWMHSGHKTYRAAARCSMLLVLLSCWHLRIFRIPLGGIFEARLESGKVWIVLDEVFNWMLFTGLGYMLFASAPAWLKNQMRRELPT